MEVKEASFTVLEQSMLSDCDFSFVISEVVTPPFDRSLESNLRTVRIPEYNKSYGFDEEAFGEVDGDDKFLAIVSTDRKIKGYILTSKSWNDIAAIDDIALDKSMRGFGNAKKLLALAENWARKQGMTGLRAETQSNNVAACNLYRSYGFHFGGYDEYLYKGIPEHAHETALFWYLLFDS